MALSFFGGMAESFGESLDEQHKYIRGKRAKDRDFLMTYGVQAVTGAKGKVNDAVNIGMQLETMGLPKADINFIVDQSGPAGLSALYERVKGYTPDELTPDVFKSMIKRTAEYKPSNMTYQEMIEKTFGLYKANVTDDPAENEKVGFWSSMGFDPDAADSALDEQYIGGYTGRDIKRIMGTAPPGMTAPLAVDFSLLPKRYSPQAQGRFATDTFSRIEREANVALNSIAQGAKAIELLEGKDLTLYTSLAAAIKGDKYERMVELVPSIGDGLLKFNDLTGGGLSNNPFFLQDIPNFFSTEASKRTGDATGTSTIEIDYSKAYNLFPNMPALADIKTYNTAELAAASGDPFFILNGKLTRNKDHESFKVVGGGSEVVGGGSAAADVVVGGSTDTLAQQMLSLDVPDNETDGEAAGTNPVLDGWNNITDKAMADLQSAFNDDFRVNSTNRTRLENEKIKDDYAADKLQLSTALENIKSYLQADASGASKEVLEGLAVKMTTGLDTAPEDVQSMVMGLIENLENEEFPPPTRNFGGQLLDFGKSVISKLPKSTAGSQESGFNLPEDVTAMGQIPYTELRTVAPPPSRSEFFSKLRSRLREKLEEAQTAGAPPEETRSLKEQLIKLDDESPSTEFVSFDSLKSELKLGNLRDGDVIKYGGKYFTVNQKDLFGAIGQVKVIGQ